MEPDVEIPVVLQQEAEAFAQWMGLSVSELYTKALEEYLYLHQFDMPTLPLTTARAQTVWLHPETDYVHSD